MRTHSFLGGCGGGGVGLVAHCHFPSTLYLFLFLAAQLKVCRLFHSQEKLDQTVSAVQPHAVGDEGLVSRWIFSG